MSERQVVVRENGELVTKPERLTQAGAIIALDLLDEIATHLSRLRTLEEDERSEGDTATFTLSAGPSVTEQEVRHPITREPIVLQSVSFFNDGPNTVYIRLHYPSARTITLNNGESIDRSFQKAKRKLRYIYHYTDPGNSASVRVVGGF